MVQLEPKEIKTVEPGRHTGRVTEVKERTNPFEYIDFVVTVDGMEGVNLTLSAPKSLSIKDGKPQSKLAKIMANLGFDVSKPVELDDAFGKKIKYVTTEKKTDTGIFAEIDADSVELVK